MLCRRGVGQLRSGWQDKVTELTWAGVKPSHRLGTKASEVKRECSRCPSCSQCDVFELNTILLSRRTTCSPCLTSFQRLLAKGWEGAGTGGTGGSVAVTLHVPVGTGMDVWGEAWGGTLWLQGGWDEGKVVAGDEQSLSQHPNVHLLLQELRCPWDVV